MQYNEKDIELLEMGWQKFDIRPVTCPGYASVVPQTLREVYDENEALKRGTVFPELDLPYGVYGKECGR